MKNYKITETEVTANSVKVGDIIATIATDNNIMDDRFRDESAIENFFKVEKITKSFIYLEVVYTPAIAKGETIRVSAKDFHILSNSKVKRFSLACHTKHSNFKKVEKVA